MKMRRSFGVVGYQAEAVMGQVLECCIFVGPDEQYTHLHIC